MKKQCSKQELERGVRVNSKFLQAVEISWNSCFESVRTALELLRGGNTERCLKSRG